MGPLQKEDTLKENLSTAEKKIEHLTEVLLYINFQYLN